jgi:inward rectifier potassium channel
MSIKTTRIRRTGASYDIRVIGEERRPLRDLYHRLIGLSWPSTIAAIAASFLVVNAAFAVAYSVVGGVAHLAPGSFSDAFFFSVQTMGTIGYGAMYPESFGANLLVVAETIVGLTLIALATGLVFAKFSRPTARVMFTREAVIAPVNGVPTLMFRLGNERGNQLVDTQIRVVLVRTERTSEKGKFYRSVELKLARDRALSLSRSWSVMHSIDEQSPLYGLTPEQLTEQEVEIEVMAVGLDDTSMQVVHASHIYFANQILWGARHADIVSEAEDGAMVVDLRKFHDTEPTVPIVGFPYPP